MFRIFDNNDQYTGFSFDYLLDAENHLITCPKGYYYSLEGDEN